MFYIRTIVYPPYPPPYGAPYGGFPGQEPDTNLVWGILTTLLCCWPLGIVSIVYASRVSGSWHQGRYAEAQAASDKARNWAIGSVVGFASLMVVSVMILAVVDPPR